MAGFYVAGDSRPFVAGVFQGSVPWVTNAATGTTTRVGLYEPSNFNQSGTTYGTVQLLTATGFAAGYSSLYNGASNVGDALWGANLAGSGTSARIGLWGPGYTRVSDGQISISLKFLSDGGFAIGESERYRNYADANGKDVWATNLISGLTTQLGFTGTGFQNTAANPERVSNFVAATSNGYVAGLSRRYSLSETGGYASWMTNLNTMATAEVGLSGPEYGTNFTLDNRVLLVKESGFAAGTTARKGTGFSGTAIWVANPGAGQFGVRVGLTSSEFTHAPTNGQTSSLVGLTETGYSGGHSTRFVANSYAGQGAWIANPGGTTVRVGLTGTLNTRASDGEQVSTLKYVSDNGGAGGYSHHYAGSTYRGQDAWVAGIAGTTTQVGFTGGIYTASDGTQTSEFYANTKGVLHNQSGYVAGFSTHYNGTTETGNAAWIANTGTGGTRRVGLTGPDYTLGNGYEYSQVDFR